MAPIARLAMAVLLFSATFINAAPTATTVDNDAHIAGFSRAVSQAAPGVKLVYKCTVPNTMAITFDDGPFEYTADLVKLFNKKKAKATFFINGSNNGKITDYAAAVKQAYLDGHQIASHTWDHGDLATMNAEQITAEMTKRKFLSFCCAMESPVCLFECLAGYFQSFFLEPGIFLHSSYLERPGPPLFFFLLCHDRGSQISVVLLRTSKTCFQLTLF
jgi:hypothetical protein